MLESSEKNRYIIDTENEVELVRMLRQGALLDRTTPFLPDGFVPNGADIIDLACGPGGWVLEIATRFPQISAVMGVDLSESMIAFAQAQAQAQGQKRAQFQCMSILKPFPFPDNSFDLVNARFLVGLMTRSTWPVLLRECFRVTRPGGMIRLTESGPHNPVDAPMLRRSQQLLAKSFWESGMTYDQEEFALMPQLAYILREEGYYILQQQVHVMDLSYGTEWYRSWVQDMPAALEVVKPFSLKYNTITSSEYDVLAEDILREITGTKFRSHWYIPSIVGRKPRLSLVV